LWQEASAPGGRFFCGKKTLRRAEDFFVARRPCAGRKIFLCKKTLRRAEDFLWQESPEPGVGFDKTYNFFNFFFSVPPFSLLSLPFPVSPFSLLSLPFPFLRSPFLSSPFSALSFSPSCFFLLLFPLFRFRLPVFFFPFFRSFVFAFLLPFLSFFLFVSVFSFVIFVSRYFSELVFILFLHCSSPFLPLFLSFVIGKRRAAKNGNDGQKKRSDRRQKTEETGRKR